MNNEKVYQSIYDELSKYLIANWEKLVIYLEYGEASYSFSFYIKSNNEYIKCYDLPKVTEQEIAESFSSIDRIVSQERSKEKNELWSNMTILITNDGDMHADYDYTDLSNGTYQHKKDWKKKYLI